MNSATMDYWITNADSFLHQIFLIVMGSLYGLAWLFGISYKAANIYCYFVLFPVSFALFLRGWKIKILIPASLLILLTPGFENFSRWFFDLCVDFVNYLVEIFSSTYVAICVYVCVLLPLLLYLPFVIVKVPRKKTMHFFAGMIALLSIYMILIYPNFRTFLVYLQNHYT